MIKVGINSTTGIKPGDVRIEWFQSFRYFLSNTTRTHNGYLLIDQ